MKKLIEKLKEWQLECKDVPTAWNVYSKIINYLASEIKEQPNKRKSRYQPATKICAGCGGFAHGNPGHDIT